MLSTGSIKHRFMLSTDLQYVSFLNVEILFCIDNYSRASWVKGIHVVISIGKFSSYIYFVVAYRLYLMEWTSAML